MDVFRGGGSRLLGSAMGIGTDHSVRGFAVGVDGQPSGMTMTQLWTLAEIATAQWIDFADSAAVSVASAALAGCADKSGNTRAVVQSNAPLRPAQSGPMFFWDGSDDLQTMSVPQSLPCHVFFVLDLTTTHGDAPRQILGRYAPGAPYAPAIYISGTSVRVPEYFWGYGWAGKYSGAVTGRVLLECILGTNEAGFRVNGGTAVLSAHSNTAAINWVELGAAYTPQAGKFGLGEYVIVNEAVSDDTRQKIEGYLAHKWDALLGVAVYRDAFPSDHPYKHIAPIV